MGVRKKVGVGCVCYWGEMWGLGGCGVNCLLIVCIFGYFGLFLGEWEEMDEGGIFGLSLVVRLKDLGG